MQFYHSILYTMLGNSTQLGIVQCACRMLNIVHCIKNVTQPIIIHTSQTPCTLYALCFQQITPCSMPRSTCVCIAHLRFAVFTIHRCVHCIASQPQMCCAVCTRKLSNVVCTVQHCVHCVHCVQCTPIAGGELSSGVV